MFEWLFWLLLLFFFSTKNTATTNTHILVQQHSYRRIILTFYNLHNYNWITDLLNYSISLRFIFLPLWLRRVKPLAIILLPTLRFRPHFRGCFEKRHFALTTQKKCCFHAWKWMNWFFLKYFYSDYLRQKTRYTQFMRKAPIFREFEKICFQNELKSELKSY